MSDAHSKKLFFGGKKPAQRIIVRDVEEEELGVPERTEMSVTAGRVDEDAWTPPVVRLLFPWGRMSEEDGRVVHGGGDSRGRRESERERGRMDVLPPEDSEPGQQRREEKIDAHVPLISPIPIDSWRGFEDQIEKRSERGVCDRDDLLQTWLHAALDPWGAGKHATLASNVAIHSHKDVLKDRMRRQWMTSSLQAEILDGPLARVFQRIDKDPITLATRVEHVVQTSALHSRVLDGFRSYSYVWLEVAHDILCGKGGERDTNSSFEPLSDREEEWLFRILSIPLHENGVSRKTFNTHSRYYCGKLSTRGYSRVVKHIVGIIVFLDKVFSSSWAIPLWAPPLFMGEEIHSTSAVMQETLALLLDQVDIGRFLKRYGCTVSYVQPQGRCTVFHVKNVAVDLRDGVKLCRLSEMLVGSSVNAVYPALKTSERVRNIELALSNMGLYAPGVAEHIADGNRAATTGLLWDCIVKFELEKSLNINSVRLECDHILASNGSKHHEELLEDACVPWEKYPAVASVVAWIRCLCVSHGIVANRFLYNVDDRIKVLEAFLAYYGDASHSVHVAQRRNVYGAPTLFDRIDYILRGAGGIPRLLTMKEYMNDLKIDDRQLIVFYALLCKRVLCMNYEHRAAIVIQRFWRRVCHRKPGYARKTLDKWIDAARVIQRNVRPFLFRCRIQQSACTRRLLFARIIHAQATWRRAMAMRRFNSIKASALVIQTHWRAYTARWLHSVLKQQYNAAVTIQSFWRQWHCSSFFCQARAAGMIIESRWRTYESRKRFLMKRRAAVVIQSCARSMLARNLVEAHWQAALIIQTRFRAQKARKQFVEIRDASTTIQRHWRRLHAQSIAQERIQAVITIQKSFRKFRESRVQRICIMLEDQTTRLSRAMKEFSVEFAHQYRADRERRLALLEEEKKTSAARTIQNAWREYKLWHKFSAYLVETYEKSKKSLEMKRTHGSAAIVVQAYCRRYIVCKNHPMSDHLADIRHRLTEATERSRVLQYEGIEDPTTLWNMMLRVLADFDQGNVLPSKSILQDLTTCLGASSTCCTGFLDKNGVDFIFKAINRVSRDKYRHDSIIQACACLESLSGCGRFVDQVGQIVMDSGHVEAIVMLIFQLRDEHEPFHALVSLLGVLANSALFSQKVSASSDLSSKVVGVHRSLGVKHRQVASYLNKLEGRKGSDISAANATRVLFKMENQISAVEKLINKMGICWDHQSNLKESAKPYKAQGKNTIVRQVLREISSNTMNV